MPTLKHMVSSQNVAEGYSDLVCTGECRLSLETHTYFEGSFWQKKVLIFRDFSRNISLFKILGRTPKKFVEKGTHL